MAIRVAIHHVTEYEFDRLVKVFPHTVRLKPAAHSRTHIHSYSLKIQPEEHFINWQQDPFGNYLARLVFPEKIKKLRIDVEVVADITVINPFDFFVEEYARVFPFDYDKQLQKELLPYLEVIENGDLLQQWLASFELKPEENIVDFLVRINQTLQQQIGYGVRLEPGIQSCEETLTLAKGSCRDTGWLLVQILRHLGLAARFTSGYLVQLTADQKSLDGPSGPDKDFTDLHAWCEVYVPGAGWIGLDPTSGLFAGEGHIPLACTPDPMSAAPITGATGKCEVKFNYVNEVIRVHEDPRVTMPYGDDQWQTILALGNKVDQELRQQDVRLTTGGEPTFVSIDDMESAQWNTEALGEDKLRLAKDLLIRLKEHFAPGGLLHYGQGKWYPGEEIPRWSLGCFWRTDGEPLWRQSKWLAKVSQNYDHNVAHAQQFSEQLASRLKLDIGHVMPAYEDSLFYLWQEQRHPINADLTKARTGDSLDRKRLVQLLDRGVNSVTGYVLPLEWDWYARGWRSGPWKLRSDVLTLIPGDSPIGLRLPLDSLPELERVEELVQPEADPFASKGPLQPAGHANAQLGKHPSVTRPSSSTVSNQDRNEQRVSGAGSDTHTIRTALCFESRNGKLHIFMPPVKYLEHYVSLIEAIEDTAVALSIPVVLEGYEPPKDDRLRKLLVTPDPGVIEVNIQPASGWQELVENTETLYELARQCRLGTEKFMLDGRHSGTGGGNHVTFGGARPADSPFLRRPDLLMSLVTYWQHHPGLSYLFSGMFIGPTSQSPRVDEGRDESLYELEIAFQQMPDGEVQQPWLVDRLFRNLLVDITGNTHRSEFCIDKLYAAGSASGRQGLLEFRGFEMPPHARMSLVQILLLQCLISRFWKQPYRHNLVRWGTELHDKFMLPHYVWSDIRDVVRDLNDHGYPFDLQWLAPFEEFRFPHYGRTQIDDIELELRWAIEPWHVLGEEVSSFGTARYVDSSVERLQVKLRGLVPGRYVLACNGRKVNLNPTDTKGEFVAGVRYRAWQPPSALHPTIGVHTPLVFDLIDTWNGKSIGGCSYYVSHPGGRNYQTYPVNAFEAEARRVNRYFSGQHTPGKLSPTPAGKVLREFFEHKHPPQPMTPPQEHPDIEYPHTLDLRKRPR
ncbi:DUF2126 domain-containing protein [Gynuella sp.]|uniref:transglutaminase family protein n=1 Tax=Gynuella sp. TaxID=2969146 RepID=UPI003D1145F7